MKNHADALKGGAGMEIKMTDIIVTVVLLIVLALVICYIIKSKKKGHVCIGCPHAANCSKKCHHIE